MHAALVVIYVALTSPIIPLGLGWSRVLRRGSTPRSRIELFGFVSSTFSYSWLWGIVAFGPVIAPDYSDLRFNTIHANMAIALVGLIIGVVRAPRAGAPLITTSVLLLVLWSYARVVSSVV